MNTPTNQDDKSRMPGPVLPGTEPLPIRLLRGDAADSPQPRSGATAAKAGAAPGGRSLPWAVRTDISRNPSGPSNPLPPMARIREVILREVQMFRHAADDLVEVVLTPDVRTQISLRVEWRDGRVVAQARCDLGDYVELTRQWSHLQATLAGEGVRLADLSQRIPTGYTEYFNNPRSTPSRSDHERATDGNPAPGQKVATPAKKSPRTVTIRNHDSRRRLLDSRL